MTKKYKGLAGKVKNSVRKKKSKAALSSESNAKKAASRYSKKPKTSTSSPKPKKKVKSKRRDVRLAPLKANLVEQLPATGLSERGLTLKKLLKNTPNLMHANAQDVLVKNYKRTKTRSGLKAITAVCVHNDPFRPDRIKKPRDVTIICLDQGKNISSRSRVMVSCSCENYVMGGAEYANALHGASKIVYGNGEPPNFTNPGMVPFLCKHLTALAGRVIDKGD